MADPIIKVNLPAPSHMGMLRPGVAWMGAAAVVAFAGFSISGFFGLFSGHAAHFLGGLYAGLVWLIYLIGCKLYAASKGYRSFWLVLFITLANFPGLAILLLLPDMRASSSQ
ncbi:MAG TPA: hypothetical protein V6C81_20215 [Planktothrix sp.]|jgi:hypothetical protein